MSKNKCVTVSDTFTLFYTKISLTETKQKRGKKFWREREPYVKGENGSRKGYFEDYRINLKI
jgi:hypothetical protein